MITLRKIFALLMISSLALSACSTIVSSTPGPSIPGLAQTLAAETLTARQGGQPGAGLQATLQSPQIVGPADEFAPTSTPEPIYTTAPLLTPFRNNPQLGSAAEEPEKCLNAAEFVKDITIPDNTPMKAGARFIKTWQFKNSGTCTWTPDYAVVLIWGDSMSGETPKPLGRSVEPGQFIEISTELQAPTTPGVYQSSWIFQSPDGVQFGTGYQARQFFWVSIVIQGKGLGRFAQGVLDGCGGKG